jgi:hypothetical protein
MRLRVCTAVALVALAGCSGTETVEPAAEPTPARTTAAPSPTPAATLTREQAGKRYLVLVAADKANRARNAKKCAKDDGFLMEGGSSNKTSSEILANVRECTGNAAKFLRGWVAELRAEKWPADAHADIDSLARLVEAQAYAMERCSKATTTDEYVQVMGSYPQDDGSADLIRARFGLPKRDLKVS